MHMLGNVWEHVLDTYVDSYQNAPTDGHEAVTSDSRPNFVIRGGSWYSFAENLRSANRYDVPPKLMDANFGIRLVRIPTHNLFTPCVVRVIRCFRLVLH